MDNQKIRIRLRAFDHRGQRCKRRLGARCDHLRRQNGQPEAAQAFQQTTAEVREGEKWVLSLIGLFGLEAAMIAAWRLYFIHTVGPALARRP